MDGSVWNLFNYKMIAWRQRNGDEKHNQLSQELARWGARQGAATLSSQIEARIVYQAGLNGVDTDLFLDKLFEQCDVDDFMEYLEYGTKGLGV